MIDNKLIINMMKDNNLLINDNNIFKCNHYDKTIFICINKNDTPHNIRIIHKINTDTYGNEKYEIYLSVINYINIKMVKFDNNDNNFIDENTIRNIIKLSGFGSNNDYIKIFRSNYYNNFVLVAYKSNDIWYPRFIIKNIHNCNKYYINEFNKNSIITNKEIIWNTKDYGIINNIDYDKCFNNEQEL